MIFIMAIYLAGAVLLLGLAWFFLERAFGPGRIPPWRGMNAAYFRDAFCVALFGSAAVMGLNRLPALFARWPLLRHSLGASVPQKSGRAQPRGGSPRLLHRRRFSYGGFPRPGGGPHRRIRSPGVDARGAS